MNLEPTQISITLGVCAISCGIMAFVAASATSYLKRYAPMWFGGALALGGAGVLCTSVVPLPAMIAGAILIVFGMAFMSVFAVTFIREPPPYVNYVTFG